jgi:hypothetical protein
MLNRCTLPRYSIRCMMLQSIHRRWKRRELKYLVNSRIFVESESMYLFDREGNRVSMMQRVHEGKMQHTHSNKKLQQGRYQGTKRERKMYTNNKQIHGDELFSFLLRSSLNITTVAVRREVAIIDSLEYSSDSSARSR